MFLTGLLSVTQVVAFATGIFNQLFKYREKKCSPAPAPYIIRGGIPPGDLYVISIVTKTIWFYTYLRGIVGAGGQDGLSPNFLWPRRNGMTKRADAGRKITKVPYLSWLEQWAPGNIRVRPLVISHTTVLCVTLNGHLLTFFAPKWGNGSFFWMLLIQLLSATSIAGFSKRLCRAVSSHAANPVLFVTPTTPLVTSTVVSGHAELRRASG